MRHRIAALAFALLAASPAHAQVSDEALQGFADRALAEYVRPAAGVFEAASLALAEDLGTLCETPGEVSLQTARASFRQTVDAWAGLAFLTIEPMREEDRQARVFFWPDPRGITLRQVQGVLAEEDPSATELGDLRQKSVAVQGLGALEFLIFGGSSEELAGIPMSYRCRYARAVGENVHDIAGELEAALDDGALFAERLARPGPDNPLYRNPGEVVEDLIGGGGTGIELIRDRIIRPAMGETAEAARPKIAPFWRSGETLAYVSHMIGGIGDMLDAGGIRAVVPADLGWIEDSLAFETANARSVIDRIEQPFVDAVESEEGRRDLTALLYSLGNARTLVSQHLMSAAGLKAGFNALDGD